MDNTDIKLLTDEEKIDSVYKNFNNIAEKYMKLFYEENCDHKYLDKFLESLNGNKILDAGCGIGKENKYVTEKGFNPIGIDFSENMIMESRKKYPNGKFEIMDLSKLTFKENSFDGIIFINTLLYIPKGKLNQIFSGFNKVLKNNGKIIIITQEGDLEKLEEEPIAKGNYVYVCHYTYDYLKNILEDNNFNIYDYERENVKDENCPINKKLILYINKNN